MARNRSGFYNTIEYIGPRPQKLKKRNFFGGWVILLIAVVVGVYFAKPWAGNLMAAQQGATDEQVDRIVAELSNSPRASNRLAAEALRYSSRSIGYDPSYYEIDYPGGDIPMTKGVAADLVVRCYREIGVDLQQLIHEDMCENFRLYPQLWGATAADNNIDHRRVPNLQRFFSRKGEGLGKSRNALDYIPGDIVVWALSNAEIHIGVVVPGPREGGTPWVVHHPVGEGVKWQDALFDYQIIGHFRYPVAAK